MLRAEGVEGGNALMPKVITRVDNQLPKEPALKRVAAYARVSSETDRLMHSMSAQVSYYSDLIQNTPGWVYAGVYADEFISGTSIERRAEFQRLLEDCDKGLIDIVLCKSISRFARNTVDLLSTVRHLKDIGVEVRFDKENINNMSVDGELMMTLLAAFSQQESISISENVKWGFHKRFEDGTFVAASKHILGYRYDEQEEKYIIIPEEAEIVRSIFAMYLDGMSLDSICKKLNEAGHKTTLGLPFHRASLNVLIHNEIYAGDLIRQKTYSPGPLHKGNIKNHGEREQYYYEDAHEAIIDRESYEKIQEEMRRRRAKMPKKCFFSGKVVCGCCGLPYTRHKQTIKGQTYILWFCKSKKAPAKPCAARNFNESDLESICTEVLGLDTFDEEAVSTLIQRMTVLESGDVQIEFQSGEITLWKDPHITDYRHTVTLTDAFTDKIRCSICGNTYHRVNSANRWVYWYCVGKKRKTIRCNAKNYPDNHLRQISAHIMDMDDFDEEAFSLNIDFILSTNTGLEYHFKDGRVSTWQRQ